MVGSWFLALGTSFLTFKKALGLEGVTIWKAPEALKSVRAPSTRILLSDVNEYGPVTWLLVSDASPALIPQLPDFYRVLANA